MPRGERNWFTLSMIFFGGGRGGCTGGQFGLTLCKRKLKKSWAPGNLKLVPFGIPRAYCRKKFRHNNHEILLEVYLGVIRIRFYYWFFIVVRSIMISYSS